MKSILFYSAVLNGILLLCLAVVIYRGSLETPPSVAAPAPTPSAPFLWSRIESPDWATYISNLRRFQCPERDIRALIFSEVDATYRDKRNEIKKSSSDPALPLQKIQQEEDDLMASLFGDEKPANPPVAPAAIADEPARALPPGAPLITMPNDEHAMVPASFAAASNSDLNAAQLQKIQQISDRFVHQIGEQNPNDSTYADRWEKAQQEADESLKMVLGQEAYQRSMLQAGQTDTRP